MAFTRKTWLVLHVFQSPHVLYSLQGSLVVLEQVAFSSKIDKKSNLLQLAKFDLPCEKWIYILLLSKFSML